MQSDNFISCALFLLRIMTQKFGFNSMVKKTKHYLKMFDQLQNIVMKKILKMFKTTSIEMMKIECNLMSSNLQLLKKVQKYAVKIAKTGHLNNFNRYISYNFFQNTEHQGFNLGI